jgi:hypothetical protein
MDATPEFYSINAESRSQDSGFIVSAGEAAPERFPEELSDAMGLAGDPHYWLPAQSQ